MPGPWHPEFWTLTGVAALQNAALERPEVVGQVWSGFEGGNFVTAKKLTPAAS